MKNQFVIYIVLILVMFVIILGLGWMLMQNKTTPPQVNNSVTYTNTQYGFTFALPEDWKGYSVVTGTWDGDTISVSGDVSVSTVHGPMISLRNPLWTAEKPYQDIPVMIFTSQQWSDLQSDKFHIGAAPINPSELGHNSVYVFALPARYNYAYPTGWEEVDQILKTNPLKTMEPSDTASAAGRHCGGNIANPPTCPSGYHCAPDPNSHLPFGDVGGICVAN